MSSSDHPSRRRTLLRTISAAALLALAGCGYEPAFGSRGGATALMGQVETQAPTNKNAYDLVARIEERLGRPDTVRYRLGYTISAAVSGLAITPANETARYNIVGTVTYKLTDAATGAGVSAGALRNFTSYSASGTTVATDAARADAGQRLMQTLADQMVTRIIADTARPGGA